jgi:hypothetical protein
MNLTAEEGLALTNLLKRAIADDRYPLSPRVQMLQSVLDRLEPHATRAAAASLEPRVYAPPRATLVRRRRAVKSRR